MSSTNAWSSWKRARCTPRDRLPNGSNSDAHAQQCGAACPLLHLVRQPMAAHRVQPCQRMLPIRARHHGEQLLEGLRAKARRSGCGGSGCHRCCGGSGCRRGCGGSGCGDGGWRRSCVFRNYLSCCVCTLLFSLFGLLLCFMFSLSDWAGWTIGRGVATKEEAAAGQQKRGASREDS